MMDVKFANSGAEASKLRKKLSAQPVERVVGWMHWVGKDGHVYAQPPVNKRLDDAEIARRAAQKKKDHDEYLARLKVSAAKKEKLKAVRDQNRVLREQRKSQKDAALKEQKKIQAEIIALRAKKNAIV